MLDVYPDLVAEGLYVVVLVALRVAACRERQGETVVGCAAQGDSFEAQRGVERERDPA